MHCEINFSEKSHHLVDGEQGKGGCNRGGQATMDAAADAAVGVVYGDGTAVDMALFVDQDQDQEAEEEAEVQ